MRIHALMKQKERQSSRAHIGIRQMLNLLDSIYAKAFGKRLKIKIYAYNFLLIS